MSKTQFLSNIYFYFTIHILMCKSCETYNVKKKTKVPKPIYFKNGQKSIL